MGRPCQCCEEASSSSSSSASVSSISVSSVSVSSSSSGSSSSASSSVCRCIVEFQPSTSTPSYKYCPGTTPSDSDSHCYKIDGCYNQDGGSWDVKLVSCGSELGGINAGYCGVDYNVDYSAYPQLQIPDAFTDGDLQNSPIGCDHPIDKAAGSTGTCPNITAVHGNMAPKPTDPIPEGCRITDPEDRSPNAKMWWMTVRCLIQDDPANGSPIEECRQNPYSVVYNTDILCDDEIPTCVNVPPRKPDDPCCLLTKGPFTNEYGQKYGAAAVCVDWRGCSNIPIYGHIDQECDNCGPWNFSMQCQDPGGESVGSSAHWSFNSRIHPPIPECERESDEPGGGGGFGAISIYDLISSETTNSTIIDDSNLECEDGACLWECMDDGEKTYYGILLDDSDCSRRIKPCGCPDVGPDGPCVPGDIIATACGG